MHSKQVRRRRAVVGTLVVVSLILLTSYFGESTGSPLHTLQRGIVEVFSPVEEGASTVLSPVRDIAGWFSDTFKARSQVKKLQAELQQLRRRYGQALYAESLNRQLSKEVGLDASDSIQAYKPVGAHVIFRDPLVWYATIQVDKGSADGVRVGDPVLGDGALAGEVSVAAPNYSVVTLITDHTVSVAAQVEDGNSDSGILVPAVGNPNQLVLQDLPTTAPVQTGQQVVTVGFKAGPLEDLFPPGIPIGTVSNANPDNLASNGEAQVHPVADLRRLSAVQILTAPRAGAARAQVPAG